MKTKLSGPVDDRRPDFFRKTHQFKAVILLYQSSLEGTNFVNLEETQLFYSVISERSLSLYQRLARDEKLKEVSVSSIFMNC